MNAIHTRPGYLAAVLLTAPVALFAAYVAWLVVPAVVGEVVPAVVRAVLHS
jgi:hypothetical protein